jgi:hypothetical protein
MLLLIASAAYAADEPPQVVTARAWFEIEPIRDEPMVRVWISIDNSRKNSVEGVTFTALEVPGFERTGDCWIGSTPSCAPGATVPAALSSIAPGDRLLTWGALKRVRAEAGKVLLTGSFNWAEPSSSAASGAPATRTSSLAGGPVELTAISWRGQPFGLYNEWAKELILPLGLALAAWILQAFQQRRTERQAVWTQMLEKSAEDAEHYYMPAATGVSMFRREVLRFIKNEPTANDDAAIFYLLLVNRRMRELAKKIGGYYFKVRSAEALAQVTWRAFVEREHVALPKESLDRAVGYIDPHMLFGEYKKKLTARPALGAETALIKPELQKWIAGGMKVELTLLDLFLYVLNLEMNRPFERWYGTRERASASTLASFGTALGPYWIDKDVAPIKAALENYRLETISWWMIVREKWQEARATAKNAAGA